MKKQIVFILLLFSGTFYSQGPCANMDFEYGNATGWDLFKGNVNGQVAQITNTSPTTLANNAFTIYNGGTDAQGGFPRVNPNSGNYSLMIGDYINTGYGAASARRTFLVDSSNANFQYSFAVVLEDPGHSHADMPFFKVNVYDQNGALIPCGEYLVVAGGALDASWSPYPGGWYRDWHTVFVPLEPYLGTNVTIEFVSGDCDQGGHYGYAYVDAKCQPIELIPPGTEICGNQPVTFNAPNGAISYLWNTGATTQSITTNVAGTYTVVATPVQGAACNATFSATIDVAPGIPTANFNVDTTLCLDEVFSPTDLSTATNSAAISYWSWNFGDGSSPQLSNNPTHFYTNSGTYEIELITAVVSPAGSGCYDTTALLVDVQGIEANFSSNFVCEGTVTSFADLSQSFNSSISDWQWDFNSDGTIDNTIQNPTYGFSSAGNYITTLFVSTPYGCQDFVSFNTTVNPVPNPSFSPNIVCLGDTTLFSNNSTINSGNIVSYFWNFNENGNTSTNNSPSYSFSQPGNYVITLQAQSDSGCVAFLTDSVFVANLPSANFNFQNSCQGEPVTFSDLSMANSGTISSWNWDVNQDGILDYSIGSPLHTYNTAGNYATTLTVTNSFNCVDSISQAIEVYTLPNADFSTNNTCEDSIVNFSNSSSINNGVITNYLWDFGNGNTSSLFEPSEIYLLENTYTISLITESDFGCTDTFIDQLEVYPNPSALFNFTNSCEGNPIGFTDLSAVSNTSTTNFITNWNWDFNDNGASSTSQNPSYQFSQDGTYSVSLEITTNNNCHHDTSFLVTCHPNPVVDFTSLNPEGCSEWCVDFQNNSSINSGSIASFYWNLGNGYSSTAPNPNQCYVNNGTSSDYYDVTLTALSDNGCSSDETYVNFVGVHPLPEAFFSASKNSASMYYPYFEFYDNSIIADFYNWNFNGLGSSSLENPVFIFPEYQTGNYAICLDVSTIHGCIDQYCENVSVTGESEIFIPNAFSPDGDGVNEVFKPEMYGISADNYQFIIYDRWGNLIFNTNNPTVGWDGKINGSAAKIDVYVWKVQALKELSGHMIDKVGHVNLIR